MAENKSKSKHARCVDKVRKSGSARNPYAVCNSNEKTKRPKKSRA